MSTLRFARPRFRLRTWLALLLVGLLSLGTLVSGSSDPAFAHHRPGHAGGGDCAGPPSQRPAHCFDDAEDDSPADPSYEVDLSLAWEVASDPDAVFSEELATGDLAADPAGSLNDGDTFEVTQSNAGHPGCDVTRTVGLGTQTLDADDTEEGVFAHTVTNTIVCEAEQGSTDSDSVDHEVTGDQAGLYIPAGENWQLVGDVTSTENIIVRGTLTMRPGTSLTFTDVDESRFVGGGMDVVDSDVGIWVMGEGQLDIQGTPVQGWNRTGTHATWKSDHEYVRAPNAQGEESKPWNLGDPVPCTRFAGEDYCSEIANLTRDITIQGEAGGESHVFIRSTKPQTIKHVALRHMGPNGDGSIDGRYGLHFHHAHDGSRGTLVEGVVVRDSGDHAFAPHESNGITFKDTVAYNVKNTPYWWDPGDHSNDIRYERALALDVHSARDQGAHLNGFRMARGTGNACVKCVASNVMGGRPSSGFGWTDDVPNKWLVQDSVSHHNVNGVYHWRNEPRAKDAHEHAGFVAYHNRHFGIEQGAYVIKATWEDTVAFGNGWGAIWNRGAGRGELTPGIGYQGGVLGGGEFLISITKMASCPSEGNYIEFRDLHLLDWTENAVHVDKPDCDLHGGRFDVRFKHVVVGPHERELERTDFTVDSIPPDGRITVQQTDGSTFTIEG